METKKKVVMTEDAKRLNVVFEDFEGGMRAFAQVLNSSLASVSRMLSGEQPIPFEVVKTICYKLGYNPTWMITGQGARRNKVEKSGKILIDLYMLETENQILRKRMEVMDIKLKYYDEKIEELLKIAGQKAG
ncbi:hypothetical protein GCM10023149_49010 [Mucilaginibacter gynuensis]|uniref:Bacteriophage CI repressor-like protein n=1 Tax=Mucilaginibacter gynuensis TaxID=1302236 RepID=A0ABP8HFS8_9SPHI